MTYSAESINMTTTGSEYMEKELKPSVRFIGRLQDLGIGNPSGIPSELADADNERLTEYGEKIMESLDDVTDLSHYGCIDGRFCKCNADGSKPEVRRRQVGGTGLLPEVALNSDASILDTIEDKDDVGNVVNVIEADYQAKTGVKRSAHLGRCGGVLGAVVDNRAISENPAIMDTVEAIMSLPEVIEYTDVPYDNKAAAHVSERAGMTADWLELHGWDGETYVDGVREEEPAGVEDLEVEDDEYGGHKEPAIAIVVSRGEVKKSLSEAKMKELGITAPFVINIDASVDMAEAMSGQQGEEGKKKALIANLAKHVAVANRLPSDKTPIFLLVA
jgi:hypothetical protein